ncbi:cache domain-containing sensor histidine kinase [Konateibacter massiliensis]|uniref:cache domain-containing sensor histidine kinase n=1 Tax=Konateibacter massiliensis TaxID=2002841 RepID=UPI000C150FEB|nr:sensor histidine kinase [Konateibacter massiliensis]
MGKKHYSQKIYLFAFYGVFTLLLLLLFFSFFYLFYSKKINTDAQKQIENLCTSVNNSVLAELDNMSTISMNITYSNVIRSNFVELSSTYSQNTLTKMDLSASRQQAVAIFDAITSIIGPFQSASEVNLYTLSGECVESGFFQRVTHITLEEQNWYEETKELRGSKFISQPVYKSYLPGEGANQNSQMFISLTRQIYNSASEPDGFIEVIQDCGRIFSLVSTLEKNNPSTSVFIYNNRGELVYPYHSDFQPKDNYFTYINDSNLNTLNTKMITLKNDEKVLYTYDVIPNYDWFIIVTEPQASVNASLHTFRNIFFAIAIATIILTSALCFIISEKLTYPLSKLTNATKKLTINRVLDENKSILTSADSNIAEIAQLCDSFRTMYEKLRISTQEVLLSHSEETRAKLQATQSLVNPHFLYNSLTHISIMAEENMNDEIVLLCDSLCDYFRYISNSSHTLVSISQEILHTEKYIDCMKLRFGNGFFYSCEIEEEAKQIMIPRLILQPVVENAFKYAFQKPAPWKLSVKAFVRKGCWMISITDNGGLLSEEKKKELLDLYSNLNKEEELNSLQIGGMGLKNIYLRMQLLYGKQAVFEIETSISLQTTFILGGPIHPDKEGYHEYYTTI